MGVVLGELQLQVLHNVEYRIFRQQCGSHVGTKAVRQVSSPATNTFGYTHLNRMNKPVICLAVKRVIMELRKSRVVVKIFNLTSLNVTAPKKLLKRPILKKNTMH